MNEFDHWKADYLAALDSFWATEEKNIKKILKSWMVERMKETKDPCVGDYDQIGIYKRYETAE